MEIKTASQLHHLDVEWQLLLCFYHLHFKDKNKNDKDKASHFPKKSWTTSWWASCQNQIYLQSKYIRVPTTFDQLILISFPTVHNLQIRIVKSFYRDGTGEGLFLDIESFAELCITRNWDAKLVDIIFSDSRFFNFFFFIYRLIWDICIGQY